MKKKRLLDFLTQGLNTSIRKAINRASLINITFTLLSLYILLLSMKIKLLENLPKDGLAEDKK